VFVAQTGFPLTPSLSTNPANTTTPLRPTCVRDGNLPPGVRTVDRWSIAAETCSAAPAWSISTFSSREPFRSPIIGTSSCELKSSMLAIPCILAPNLFIDQLTLAGRITSTQSPARQVQLGVRIAF
jgi:hypothetical protein